MTLSSADTALLLECFSFAHDMLLLEIESAVVYKRPAPMVALLTRKAQEMAELQTRIEKVVCV